MVRLPKADGAMAISALNSAEKKPHGNSKVTRDDWLRVARDVLVNKGVAEVKILALSA